MEVLWSTLHASWKRVEQTWPTHFQPQVQVGRIETEKQTSQQAKALVKTTDGCRIAKKASTAYLLELEWSIMTRRELNTMDFEKIREICQWSVEHTFQSTGNSHLKTIDNLKKMEDWVPSTTLYDCEEPKSSLGRQCIQHSANGRWGRCVTVRFEVCTNTKDHPVHALCNWNRWSSVLCKAPPWACRRNQRQNLQFVKKDTLTQQEPLPNTDEGHQVF